MWGGPSEKKHKPNYKAARSMSEVAHAKALQTAQANG
jgi:hypothetical protein